MLSWKLFWAQTSLDPGKIASLEQACEPTIKLKRQPWSIEFNPSQPWVVYGQYLIVQPWSIEFNPSQPYPNMVMAWIRLPGLSGHMYKRKILWEIGGMIGRVAKLDFNTDNGVRARFARMVVYVNLGKALISQVLINGVL
ncbi:hypothetical protein Goarm_018588 [Gossypium armourianum]|uniref:DUF4283 domain-containing protein n=1 Tax=Gossypium armourianum TaxID=34283 RepID=A0A7J9IIT7_9ROSI|nr:hypothetical protein [Gossypium armourianum]